MSFSSVTEGKKHHSEVDIENNYLFSSTHEVEYNLSIRSSRNASVCKNCSRKCHTL